ncbi:hypothetical protein A6A07_30540 [Streptomyces sp. CB03911]|nr:hypothetical protein A6A07_30540 [Streptomyces sp. CB03911]
MIGEGVLDGDALGGVFVACPLAGCVDFRCGDLVGLPRWRDGFARMVASQAQVAVIEQYLDFWELPEEVVDALASYGGGVVHASWAEVAGPQGAALCVGDDGGLHRVLLLLAGHEGPRSAAV